MFHPVCCVQASVLELESASVLARAAFLLHCAHLVRPAPALLALYSGLQVSECNKGNWAGWLARPQPAARAATGRHHRYALLGSALHCTGLSSIAGTGRHHKVALQAGRLFHAWGEAVGERLGGLVRETAAARAELVQDEARQRELLLEDEEEDFLDEATVNPSGRGCPPALLLCACTLLAEITAFMRETYRRYALGRNIIVDENIRIFLDC